MVAAQKSYTLSGSMPKLKEPAKVYLVTLQNGAWKETDSIELKNGKFQFVGAVDEPQQAILSIKRLGTPKAKADRDSQGFFLENSTIYFNGVDSIQNATITGSVSNQESMALEALTKPLTNKIMQLNNKYSKYNKNPINASAEERKKASDTVMNLVAEIKSVKLNFVKSHLNSFMGLYTFHYSILDSKFIPVEVEPIFNQFSMALKSSPLGKKTIEKIEIGKRRQTGIAATDFIQNDLDGKPFKLSSLRGKYVLVDFWASWCVPCRNENPNVVKAYTALKDKNFEIVSVSLDYPGGKEAWTNAIKTDGMPWIHVSDLKGWKNEVAQLYGINSVPQNILVNPEGLIVAKNLRGENLLEQLKAFIK